MWWAPHKNQQNTILDKLIVHVCFEPNKRFYVSEWWLTVCGFSVTQGKITEMMHPTECIDTQLYFQGVTAILFPQQQ